jgi:tRNA G18 (ribose-2'-O)-methylase SpoU
MILVDDPADPRLARFRLNERGLANRADKRDDSGAGLFLAEGDLVVERALAGGCRPVAALVDRERVPPVAASLEVDIYAGGKELRRYVTGLGHPLPIVALFERPARPTVTELARTAHRLVVLEGVDNPGNVGSIVRNAAAFGWDGLVLDHTSADPLARRSLRVAMGTAFTVPHARTVTFIADLGELRAAGFTLVALTPAGRPDSLDETEQRIGGTPCAILVGSERGGLSDGALAAVDIRTTIPMSSDVDSLNAAAASAIACYVLRRR